MSDDIATAVEKSKLAWLRDGEIRIQTNSKKPPKKQPNMIKCPACNGEMRKVTGEQHFRGVKVADCEWRECLNCGETLHSAAEIRRLEAISGKE